MSELATDRLRLVYHLSRGLTSVADLTGLVKFCTQRLRELYEAEGSALIMLDREHDELYFPVVSQVDRMARLRIEKVRFPASQGIAGWVIRNERSTIVADAQSDERHYSGVDERSKLTTRSLLAAPLRTAAGVIGVVEVVNPDNKFLTDHDLEFLDHMASDIALACERARLFDVLNTDMDNLRRRLRLGGLAGVGTGVAFVAASLVLPPAHLVLLGMIAGLIGLAAGVSLYFAGRQGGRPGVGE